MAKVKLIKSIPNLAYFIGDEFEMDDAKAKDYAEKGRVEILAKETKQKAPKK